MKRFFSILSILGILGFSVGCGPRPHYGPGYGPPGGSYGHGYGSKPKKKKYGHAQKKYMRPG